MAAEYTVKQVVGVEEEWGNDYGKFTPYELLLSGPDAPDATVQINRKQKDGAVPEDKVPKQGETLYGSITSTNHGYRFKSEQRDNGGAPQQRSQGSSQEGPTEEYWQERNRRIERQHSQEMALRFAALSGDLNGVTLGNKEVLGTLLNNALRPLIDWFAKDVASGQAEAEPSNPDPQPAPAKTDEDIPF